MSEAAYIGLGSNADDRRRYLDEAIYALTATPGIVVGARSSLYETQPVGGPPDQDMYLNAVVAITTTLSPRELMDRLLAIEAALGRVRTVKDGPRTLDLDILLYGSRQIDEPQLTIPHPRMHERHFVLEPFAEIAPTVMHPALQRSIGDLRAGLLGVRLVATPMVRELAGVRAVVTGSTSGIGRAIALELASAGADVMIHGRESWEEADAVAEEARNLGGWRSGVLMADLDNPSMCNAFAEFAWSAWGGLDVFVNNAGMDTLTGEAARWSFEEKLEALWNVDVKATLSLSRQLGKRMKQAGRGVVINIGWDQAETGMEGESGELFAAIKGAVMSHTRSLALSLAPQVRVNCVAPGWIRTAWGEHASQAWQERVRRETPLGVWGQPCDVAQCVRWLVSPAAAYVTGQIIRCNGGAVR